jgi:YD repeat-containing protein
LSAGRNSDFAGRVSHSIGLSGETTLTRYDSLGRVIRIEKPDGGHEQIHYNNLGSPAGQHVVRLRPLRRLWIGFEYFQTIRYFDGFGEVYKTQETGDGGRWVVKTWSRSYSNFQEILTTSDPHHEGDDPRLFEVTRDRWGSPIQLRRGVRTRTSPAWRDLDRTTHHRDRIEHTDARGALTKYRIDARGRLRSIDQDSVITNYIYDAALRPMAIVSRILTTVGGEPGRLLTHGVGQSRMAIETTASSRAPIAPPPESSDPSYTTIWEG